MSDDLDHEEPMEPDDLDDLADLADHWDYEHARQESEREMAEEWCEGYDRLVSLGVLDRSKDDHTNTTIADIRQLLSYLPSE